MRYEVLLQMAPFGFLLIDLSGIVERNQQAVNILGSTSVEETKQINTFSYPQLEKSWNITASKRCNREQDTYPKDVYLYFKMGVRPVL